LLFFSLSKRRAFRAPLRSRLFASRD
jgi:hypothetical protein